MTAIPAAAPPSMPVAPSGTTNNFNLASSFSKFFGNESDSPTASPKKKGDDETNAAVIAFIPAPLKLLQPVTLSMVDLQLATPTVQDQPTDDKPEKLDVPRSENPSSPAPGELAFAAKLVQTDLPQTAAEPASKPAPAASTPPVTPKFAPPAQDSKTSSRVEPVAPTLERRAGPSQHRSDIPPPAEVSASARAQHDVVASQTPVAAQTAVVRDMNSSSSLMSRAIESAPEIHAVDRLAALQASAEHARPPSHLQEISIRVEGREQNAASIRMIQNAGEIRVAVRATDPQLADSLRANVEQLTSRLNNNGMSAEVWKPSAVPAAARSQSPSQDMPHDRQGSPAQQWRGATARDRQNDKQKRPDWAEPFEQ